ncbi:MAG: hypothetical protein QXV30_06830 [Desulfurococcaceae archaeon]
MSEYLAELKKKLSGNIGEYEIVDKDSKTIYVVKGGNIVATIRDAGDVIVINLRGKEYRYDKWYSKPEHLATTLVNYFKGK